jgi:hypothetical protein
MPKSLEEQLEEYQGAGLDWDYISRFWSPVTDPLKQAMGFAAQTAGQMPIVKGAGAVLDYADVAPEEQMSAPLHQSVVSGLLDPGGNIAQAAYLGKQALTGAQPEAQEMFEAQAVGSALPDITPGPLSPAMIAPKFRVRAVPSMAEDVVKKKMVKQRVGPKFRKDRPHAASARKAEAEILTDPGFEVRMQENIGDNRGLFSDKARMQWEKRQLEITEPLQAAGLPTEQILFKTDAPPRTLAHEKGHARWQRLGEAQKADFRRRVDIGEIAPHPMMEHPGYDVWRPGPARDTVLKQLRDSGEYALADRMADGWYDEIYNHWMADYMEGDVLNHMGGRRPFGAEELPVVNYFQQELFKPGKVPARAVSPLADAPKGVTEALLRKMGPG